MEEFQFKMKLWNPENCPYRLCKRFLPESVFITDLLSFNAAYFIIFMSHFYFAFESILTQCSL